jgi:hypothetical protein
LLIAIASQAQGVGGGLNGARLKRNAWSNRGTELASDESKLLGSSGGHRPCGVQVPSRSWIALWLAVKGGKSSATGLALVRYCHSFAIGKESAPGEACTQWVG